MIAINTKYTKLLNKEVFQIDERIKYGWYSDVYLNNTAKLLEILSKEGYTFEGDESDLVNVDTTEVENGDIIVEQQFFTRRKPFSVVVGIEESLAILEECTGYYNDEGNFVNTYDELEVEAVEEGTMVSYNGDPLEVKPVLRVRGKYRYFAHLETVILGVLSEPTRVATNVYNTLVAAKGKDVLFFPARFTHYKIQPIHGHAYIMAVNAYNKKFKKNVNSFISTNEQGAYWGKKGGGTVAHATIASFLGNTQETMMQFARLLPTEVPRIALVDFHNDCVSEAKKVLDKMFTKYWSLYSCKKFEEAKKYKLYGVRPDTSGNMIDKSIDAPFYDEHFGVNPTLIWRLRKSIDEYANILIDRHMNGANIKDIERVAKEYCTDVKILVTGGFNVEKINKFEKYKVPVDIYGVGSSLLDNSKATNNDYTADVVMVKVNDKWHHLAKEGRNSCDNEALIKVK